MPRKFLVVDDDAGIRGLLKRFLEAKGCCVSEAIDGVEAVKRFEEDRPDVVLLDILLPRAIGFEVCRKIKGLSGAGKTPIVMMSAVCKTTLDELRKNFQCPADGFLTKPFQLNALLPYLGDDAAAGLTADDAKLESAFMETGRTNGGEAASASRPGGVSASPPPPEPGKTADRATASNAAPATPAAKARPTLITARVVAPTPVVQQRTEAPPAVAAPKATAPKRENVIVASAAIEDDEGDAAEPFAQEETTVSRGTYAPSPNPKADATVTPREHTEWLSRLARAYLEQVVGRATCDLAVSRGEYHRVVSLAGGLPVDVTSHFRHENLGTFLMLRGDITEAEYNDCLEHMISHGCSVDESTVHLGLLAPAQVGSLTLAYKLDLLASAFAWRSGDLAVRQPAAPTHVGVTRLRIDPIAAALEGIGRVYGDAALCGEMERARGMFLVSLRGGERFIEAVRPVFNESLWRALWEGRTAVHALADILGPTGTACRRAVKLLEVVGAVLLGERGGQSEIAKSGDAHEGAEDAEVEWGTGTHSLGSVASGRPVAASAESVGVPDAATEEVIWSEALRMARLDHFGVLGVERGADPAVLSHAFRRLLLKYDPLRMEALRDSGARDKAWEIIERGAASFGALTDGEFREIYDRRLDHASSQPLAVPQIDPEVQFARGKNLIALEDFAGAVEAFRRALDVRPDFAEAHLFLGLAMYQADPRESVAEDAIGHMTRAIDIDPKNDMAYYYLGQVYRRLGIADKARTMFQRAVELNLSNVLANRELKPGR